MTTQPHTGPPERTKSPDDGSSTPAVRTRWAVRFAVRGDLKFLGHQDMLRTLRRLAMRADLPLSYSEGFNPRPRMSLPCPRPVGIESEDEMLVLDLEGAIGGETLIERLGRQTVRGLAFLDARPLPRGCCPQPRRVHYRLEVVEDHPSQLADRVRKLCEAPSLWIERPIKKGPATRQVDLRPFLVHMAMNEGGVEFILAVEASGSARPAEVAGLLGFDPRSINHRIRRIRMEWHNVP